MPRKRWILIGAIVAVLLIGGLLLFGQNSAAFTVYPVFCKDWGDTPPTTEDFSNCHQPYAYAREMFALNKDKGQITETSPDNGNFYTLNNCTIQDNEHWGCSGQNNDAFGYVDPSRSGDHFSENGAYGTATDTIFVTESQWDSINNGAPSQGY